MYFSILLSGSTFSVQNLPFSYTTFLHLHLHSIIMADDPIPTGWQQLENKQAFRRGQQPTHPHLQAGEDYKYLSENSSNTTRTKTPPQGETDQQTLVLSEHRPVSSFFPLVATMTLLTAP
jgi:hypothetical protein